MDQKKVILAHGSGGKLSHELVNQVFIPKFANQALNKLDDQAQVQVKDAKLAFSTDSFVVNPIMFPGGNIGKLAVCGTVNDLAMGGAKPLYLSAGFIIEEGLPMETLEQIVESMHRTAQEAGVEIVTGDTKVVEKGSADGIFINTAGIGLIPEGLDISGSNAQPGDVVIINGFIGDHGIAVMAERQGLRFQEAITSDCAPLNHLVADILAVTNQVRVFRDPTRGGVATTLNEIAEQSNVGISLFEDRLPVRDSVRGVCEILGLDPLYVANEGKLLAIVPADRAEGVLAAMRANEYGRDAQIIGEVTAEHPKKVVLETIVGGKRIVDMLAGAQLPRIC